MIQVLLRMLPLTRLAFSRLSEDLRGVVLADVERWAPELEPVGDGPFQKFRQVFLTFPEFRSLLYYRLAKAGYGPAGRAFNRLLAFCYPRQVGLCIYAKEIGKGLRIQHGIATIIAAETIGENCLINQQVTIGYSNKTDRPTIGDDVSIRAGAKVIGGVVIGDHVKVGANAVVLKDVPPNCTVVGVPARIVKRDGVKVDEKL